MTAPTRIVSRRAQSAFAALPDTVPTARVAAAGARESRPLAGLRAAVADVPALRRTTTVVFLATLAYGALRYVTLGPWQLADLPLYVTNKAVAVTAAFALLLAPFAPSAETRKWCAAVAMRAGTSHLALTALLFGPAYFAKWLAPDGRPLPLPALALLLGVALPWLPRRAMAPALLAHLACMGAAGWLAPATWPGRLPPITLLAALPAAYASLQLFARQPAARE